MARGDNLKQGYRRHRGTETSPNHSGRMKILAADNGRSNGGACSTLISGSTIDDKFTYIVPDSEEAFREEVRGYIINGIIRAIPELVITYSGLTKQHYSDYIVTRAGIAKEELTRARKRANRSSFAPYSALQMTSVQTQLTSLIREHSAPSSNGNSGDVQIPPKPDCYKACCGY